MRLIANSLIALAVTTFVASAHADWPCWRGPNHDGSAAKGTTLPTEWSSDSNIRWKAPLPGRGHGSPTVVGERVFIASADLESDIQAVHCFERASGKELWTTPVHTSGLFKGGNKKASQASTTVASDGERLYVNFLNSNAIYTTALSLEGKQVWQTKISEYQVHQGYGSSPFLYKSLVLVSADNKGGGAIAGLDRESGDIIWRRERMKDPNYSSPVVVHAAGQDQLIFTGLNKVCSFNPLNGEPLWEMKGATTECVTTTVTDGKHVYSSGGYPKNHVAAIAADGSGKVAWENGTRVYVPSMVIRDGYLYAVADAGIAICWEAATGKEMWKQRLGGVFTSSLVRVDDEILAVNESGDWFVFKADPSGYQSIAKLKLGDEVLATPAVSGSSIYARIAIRENGQRQEYLVAIGE